MRNRRASPARAMPALSSPSRTRSLPPSHSRSLPLSLAPSPRLSLLPSRSLYRSCLSPYSFPRSAHSMRNRTANPLHAVRARAARSPPLYKRPEHSVRIPLRLPSPTSPRIVRPLPPAHALRSQRHAARSIRRPILRRVLCLASHSAPPCAHPRDPDLRTSRPLPYLGNVSVRKVRKTSAPRANTFFFLRSRNPVSFAAPGSSVARWRAVQRVSARSLADADSTVRSGVRRRAERALPRRISLRKNAHSAAERTRSFSPRRRRGYVSRASPREGAMNGHGRTHSLDAGGRHGRRWMRAETADRMRGMATGSTKARARGWVAGMGCPSSDVFESSHAAAA